MVLIVAGVGGATDIKLASIIVETAKDQGIFTLSMLSAPLPTEGQQHAHEAAAGIAALSKVIDSE